MSLELFVASAVNLSPMGNGKINPYLQFDLRGTSKEISHKPETLDPVWEEVVMYDLRSAKPLTTEDVITVTAKSYESLGAHKIIGSSVIPLNNILNSKGPLTCDIELKDVSDKPCGTIYLKALHQPDKDNKNGNDNINGTTSAMFVRKREFSNKPEKFQVRIKIIEARNLNGDDLNPLCRIRLGEETRQTSIQRITNQPWWDEMFNITINKKAEEFFNDSIKFEILNSKILRTNAIIGCFVMSLRSVYDQPNHAYVNKWLMLASSEIEDSDNTDDDNGVLGYLKISVAVLATGDDCPSFKTDPQSFDEDVESNLLWPENGAILQPAYFSLSLYQAEDLPRMDSAVMDDIKKFFGTSSTDKELVDPYIIVSFCGRQVNSKIIYTSDHPKWHQILNLSYMFPSLSNQLKLILMDWDRVSEDDIIATAFIDLSTISSAGEDGFLPNFGPSFINFYGSSREFSTIQSDLDLQLNSGKQEGYSYRGRALLTIKTSMGLQPESLTQPIESDELLRIAPFCRCRKYILKGIFLDATMIGELLDSVEFQMSIGLYGDKFENTSMPSISTTLPTAALFDGCKYYYLPWTKSKPCLMVPCQWEDISFRLETLNLLERIISRLEENLKRLNVLVRAGISNEDQGLLLKGILEKLINDCRTKLPEPEDGRHVTTELDKLMNALRKKKLQELIDQAEELQMSTKTAESILEEFQIFKKILQKLAVEAQNSMPDVIISMLTGKKLIAYYRIPAHTILFSPNKNFQGQFCDEIQTLCLKYPGKDQSELIPAMLRIKLWLGLETQHNNCAQSNEEAELCIFAETYENQVNILGKWTTRGPMMTRATWSDSYGQMSIPREKFTAPTGWTFEGEWFISPEISKEYEQDAECTVFLEIIVENQCRGFGGTWHPTSHPWTDLRGNPTVSWEQFQCPNGWEWNDYWQVDLQRAVDEEGWEYAIDGNFGGFSACEKTYHMFRSRRWTRSRAWKNLHQSLDDISEASSQIDDSEGWEYATMFNKKFHITKQKLDLVRRRRWHRKLVPISHGPLPVFHFADSRKHDKPMLNIFQNDNGPVEEDNRIQAVAFYTVPRMQIIYKEEYKFDLRVYVYQARDLIAADKTGFSDPFTYVCFQNRSQKSEIIKQTLCPTWDQTLIFTQLSLYGQRETILKNIPKINVEIYDYDNIGPPEFLGRTMIDPKVHKSNRFAPPKLQWFPVKLANKPAGELLAAAEIFQADNENAPPFPPRYGNLYKIPPNIKPLMQRTAIEILCWGLRNIKPFEFLSVNHPSVIFEMGESSIESATIKSLKSTPNFQEPLLFIDMMLPMEELYMPAINIKVLDHRQFGRTPVVGTHVITNLRPFFCESLQDNYEEEPELDEEPILSETERITIDVDSEQAQDTEDELDWWAKYYASNGEVHKSGDYLQSGFETIQIHDTELERVEQFENFTDFLTTFPLNRGKLLGQDDDGTSAGELKGTFRIYPLPEDEEQPLPPKVLQWLPSSSTVEVLVRVYVIRAYDLVPKDPNGLADPYISVKMGKFKANTRKIYKPKTLEPVFGQLFEFSTILPLNKDLAIRIYDMDLIGSDDLIGETIIDLENRYLSRHRALCGLPKQYFINGPYQWREVKHPREILEDICLAQNLPIPRYKRGAFYIGKSKYTLHDFEKRLTPIPYLGPVDQRLALHILHTMSIVPEHVETRRLFNPSIPGMDQGKLEMWIDIYPKSFGNPPPPVNILPRTPKKYELRCVIWNTKDVAMKDVSISGELMSDIYVKGWIDGSNECQKTDIHYRSLDGEGNFNWRFVFNLDYLAAEKTIIMYKKEHFWEMDLREYHFSPKLCIQLWDNDMFASDDFIGYLDIDLLNIPKPVKEAENCGLHQLNTKKKKKNRKWWKRKSSCKMKAINENIDLFEKKHIYGFWPCIDDNYDQPMLTGKIEMELELLTLEEAEERPAGKGRDEPNANPFLAEPKRPEYMVQWMLAPLKAFKVGVWDKIKWQLFLLLLILLLIAFVLIGVYTFPQAVVDRVVKSF